MHELLKKLRAYETELELRNEALICAQLALDTIQARHIDFYDLAPVGYLTVSKETVVLEANLTIAMMLGLPRESLIGRKLPAFMLHPDADIYQLLCQQVFSNGAAPKQCELRLRNAENQVIWVKLRAITATGVDGAMVVRIVISDISERKQADATQLASTQLTAAI